MIGRIAIGAVLALFAVAYGVALQNLHAAGCGDRNAQAERASFANHRGEGIVYSSRRVPRLS
jgi:hypothetical protein